jgi:hypothetical protein
MAASRLNPVSTLRQELRAEVFVNIHISSKLEIGKSTGSDRLRRREALRQIELGEELNCGAVRN